MTDTEPNSFKYIAAADLAIKDVYHLIISAVVPRPIAFVSTIGLDGSRNLAPFSSFNIVSSRPPCVSFCIITGRKGKKDTMRNIEETNEFVINSSNEWLFNEVVECGTEFPYGLDEMQKVGLTPLPATHVKPMRFKEAAWSMECRTYKLVPIGEGGPGSATMVIGEIIAFHVREDLLKDGRISSQNLQPLSRLGGTEYGTLGKILSKAIPQID